MKNLIFILIILFSFLKDASALDYDPSVRLRRLSIHLTGLVPSPEDIAQLKQTAEVDLEKFFLKKTDEYLQSANFVKKMQINLNHLFFVNYQEYSSENALDKLFTGVISKNENWDSFLVQKEYEFAVSLPFSSGTYNDMLYYSYLYKEQINSEDVKVIKDYLENFAAPQTSTTDQKYQTVKAQTTDQKNATAGAITTGRFFERFPTTKLNKNRKRAAAVFRIFLCDDMRPVILPNSSADLGLLLTSLDANNSTAGHTDSDEKKHGTDPTCQSCHYKLDPLADTFNGSSRNLNKAFPGGLVYKREDGSMVNIPVSGLGELGLAITKQPEYLQCQVRHFWNWFIGEDVPIDEKQMQTLTTIFDNAGKQKYSTGRRPKDFIKYLVNSKSFYKSKKIDPANITYDMVRPIFKKCDSCHTNESLAPQLSQGYPFAINKDFNKQTLSNLVKALNLDHSQKKATMPPAKAGWFLSNEEITMISGWLKAGAKDSNGVAQIKPTDFNVPFNPQKLALIPSMYQTYYRYMSIYDFGENLEYLFGIQAIPSCFVSSTNGAIIPRLGKGLTKKPTSEYYSSFKDCFNNLFYTASGNTPINVWYSQKMFESKKAWAEHTLQEKIDHAQFVFEYLTSKPPLSQNTIEKMLVAVDEKMKLTAPPSTSVHMATYWICYFIMISDHFLVY